MTETDPIIEGLRKAVVKADLRSADDHMRSAIDKGINVSVLIDDGIAKGMLEVASMFDRGELYLPHLIASSRVAEHAIGMLPEGGRPVKDSKKPVVVIGTVRGDIHTIGKDLCVVMLRGAGYEVVDLGSDVPEDEFISAAEERGAGAIAASALMTTTLNSQRTLVRECSERKMEAFRLVGGAACSEEFSREIGADGYSASVLELIELCNRLMRKI